MFRHRTLFWLLDMNECGEQLLAFLTGKRNGFLWKRPIPQINYVLNLLPQVPGNCAGCYNYSNELAILREEILLLAILLGR